MNKTLTVRISNELGNQMFVYASSYAIAKKLNRKLYIDDETAFASRKNISKYGLNNFTISSDIAKKENKFLGVAGYIKRKILKKINTYLKYKIFFIEQKNSEKITKFNANIYNSKLSNNVYLEGYFESERYFLEIKDKIIDEFSFLNKEEYKKSPYFNEINNTNSVSICLRQNRFIEGMNRKNDLNYKKSIKFTNEQINYINKSISHIKKNVDNPVFFLWSNDILNVEDNLFKEKIKKVIHDNSFHRNLDKRSLDMFLITQCKHHVVIPSSFNWWGAWLSKKENKIVCRPHNNFFTDFKLNNLDFWPSKWNEII